MSAPEPTLAEVMREVRAVGERTRLLADEVASLRRAMLDEFAALRHLVQALDRDVDGLARRVIGADE